MLVTEAVRNFGRITAPGFAKEDANLFLASADTGEQSEQSHHQASDWCKGRDPKVQPQRPRAGRCDGPKMSLEHRVSLINPLLPLEARSLVRPVAGKDEIGSNGIGPSVPGGITAYGAAGKGQDHQLRWFGRVSSV